MKFVALCFLAICAVGLVRADAEECASERAEVCIDGLLSAVVNDATEEEVCKELRSSVDCLKEAVDDCFGDERDPEIEEGLEELEKLLKDKCASDGDDFMDSKCFEENENYFEGCIELGTQHALTMVLENDNVDENEMKCTLFTMMARCFVERVGEKCGEAAVAKLREELSTVPVEVKDACEAAAGGESYVFNLLDDKRKK